MKAKKLTVKLLHQKLRIASSALEKVQDSVSDLIFMLDSFDLPQVKPKPKKRKKKAKK